MHKLMLGWLGIVILLSSQALAVDVNYSNGENKSSPISVSSATELKFDGVTATQSGDISGADTLTITGGSGILHLTGNNNSFTGTVAHGSGTLVFAEDSDLLGLLSGYDFQGDATVVENQAVITAVGAYCITPTDENWQLVLSAIDAARDAGALPTFMIANGSNITIDGNNGDNQRLTVGNDKAGSFHLKNGAALIYMDVAHVSSQFAYGGAMNIGTGSLLTFTADDNAIGYVFTDNSATSTSTNFETSDVHGGVIYNSGIVTLTNANFTRNSVTGPFSAYHSASGGAVYNSGSMTLTNVEFASNFASNASGYAGGGAIRNRGTMTLTNVDFADIRFLQNCKPKILERLVEWGIIDSGLIAGNKPLSKLLMAWKSYMEFEVFSTRHRAQSIARMERLFADCRFAYWLDINENAITEWVTRQRQAGMSVRTANSYIATIKAFCNYTVKNRDASQNPVSHLSKNTKEFDVRLQRRPLTDDEVVRLLKSTERSEKIRYGMTGWERALVYLMALRTGLRWSELKYLPFSALIRTYS